jgi:hypothetical protein
MGQLGQVGRALSPMTRSWKSRAAVILAALLCAIAPIPPTFVERFYTGLAYPILQRTLTSVSNLTSIALLDVLIVVTLGWWLAMLVRDIRRGPARHRWARVGGHVMVRTLAGGALVYIAFLATWGLNYRRVPLTEKLAFDVEAVTAEAARDLALIAVAEVNALYAAAHAAPVSGDSAEVDLAAAFADAQRLVGVRQPARPARPKRTMLDPYFRAAAVDGMTDPFFLETLIVSDLLPFERPHVIAHEWSHLAGFADESEANFLGWLTCTQGSESVRYSGWLFLFRELLGSLSAETRQEVSARLDEGPRRDLQAIVERLRRTVNPTVSAIGWRTYDAYLRANRVESGAASYAEVIRLVLGVRFGPNWRPQLR